MRKVDPIGLAKAILWEEAKGKLRALIAATGQEQSGIKIQGTYPYERLEAYVDAFIQEVEENGLHE